MRDVAYISEEAYRIPQNNSHIVFGGADQFDLHEAQGCTKRRQEGRFLFTIALFMHGWSAVNGKEHRIMMVVVLL